MSIDREPVAPGDVERPAYVLSVIAERRKVRGARVLDLACRAGAFSVALANAGATVLGLEGRAENLAMAPEAKGVTYRQGDVRELSPETHGTFHVVLCLGILYHLGADDAVNLLRAMKACTRSGGFAIVDTHVGSGAATVEVDGRTYFGNWFNEPGGAGSGWSSIGNLRSFWFTADSLIEAARAAGWAEVEQLPGVRYPGEPAGRFWAVLS
jgi:SAM-dependent methyltransferase